MPSKTGHKGVVNWCTRSKHSCWYRFLVVQGHLILPLFEPTLLIEWDIGIAAVQNGLVAPNSLTNLCESLDDPQTKFPPLHSLINRDIFDMTHLPQSADELLLDKDTSHADDLVCRPVDDDEGKVGAGACTECIESGSIVFERDRGRGGEDRKNRKMGAGMICLSKGSHMQIRSELSFHFA